MANQPIGISFIPSQENADQGPQRGAAEGDLGQALKLISLRLPRVLGSRAITPGQNLAGAGAPGLPPMPSPRPMPPPSGVGAPQGGNPFGAVSSSGNPQGALFQALIKAMLGGQIGQSPMGDPGASGSPFGPMPSFASSSLTPRITPGATSEKKRREDPMDPGSMPILDRPSSPDAVMSPPIFNNGTEDRWRAAEPPPVESDKFDVTPDKRAMFAAKRSRY